MKVDFGLLLKIYSFTDSLYMAHSEKDPDLKLQSFKEHGIFAAIVRCNSNLNSFEFNKVTAFSASNGINLSNGSILNDLRAHA